MSKPKTGTVYLVGAGPGDPGLLTLRGAEVLAQAAVVIHDVLVNPALLRHSPASAEIVATGKRGAPHSLSQDDINRLLLDHARAGKTVVRLKGGDPYVFGRGGEEAAELASAGIPFEVVSGVSSFHAVPAYAGIPLTHRAYASAFTVVTGHEDPERETAAIDWAQIARTHGTKVILMGAGRLAEIASALVGGGLSPATPAALIQQGTTGAQRTIEGTLGNLATLAQEAGAGSPAIVVVGDIVRLRSKLNWFEQRRLFGQRIVVTRAREQAGELSSRLSNLGADVAEIPTIRVEPPADRLSMVEALAGLGEYDWVVFTSANGVTAFFDALLAAYQDIRSLGNLRIAAVGSSTAARLRELHLRVDAIPDEFVGAKVAEAIAKTESIENLRVLLARAQTANPDLRRELEERGGIVDDVAFYQTVPETTDPTGAAARLVADGTDWITFTSSSTVGHLNARIPLKALVDRHPRIRLASIGPETSKTLRELGLTVAVEAKPHTLDGLVDAIARARSER